MGVKEFLKYNLGGVIITIILLFGSYIILNPFQSCTGGPCFQGYPLEFYKPAGCGSCTGCPCYDMEINYSNLLINLVIYYLISLMLIFIFYKIKSKIRGKNETKTQ